MDEVMEEAQSFGDDPTIRIPKLRGVNSRPRESSGLVGECCGKSFFAALFSEVRVEHSEAHHSN